MIKIENLSFSYKKHEIYRNIDLEFLPGNIYGLLGENGVGKTTLLKLITGVLPPQQGKCLIDGIEAFRRLPGIMQNLYFLPESVMLPDASTPERNFLQLAKFYPKSSFGDFTATMQALESDPKQNFRTMSLGQQKKSLIATALSLGTDYILLDEPTNGLDIPSKTNFRKVLSQRVGENTTVIISTHQVKDVENLIDPIIILSSDEILLNATIGEIGQKLYFEYSSGMNPDALFSEMQPAGCLNVLQNAEDLESHVNIEGLFNAVHRNKALVKSIFGNNCETSKK